MQPMQLSTVGPTPAYTLQGASTRNGGHLPPGIVATLSDGAVLTYSIEVTADPVPFVANGPAVPLASANWAPLPSMAAQQASAAGTILFMVSGVRARITSYTSGTLALSVAE